MVKMLFTSCAIICVSFLQIVHGVSFHTQMPVIAPEEPLVDITVVLRNLEVARYTDPIKFLLGTTVCYPVVGPSTPTVVFNQIVVIMLTAIRDKKLQACFIADYDPNWNLMLPDKMDIVQNQKYESADDFYELKKKTGEVIASLCLKAKLFWFATQHNLPPPPALRMGAPPPLIPSEDDIIEPPRRDMPQQELIEPPRINGQPKGEEQAPPTIKTPPPLSQLLNLQNNDVQAPPPLRPEFVAPPPLMSRNIEEMPPPLMSQNNAEVPPPLMSQNNEGVPPPLMSQNNAEVPPPLMSQNNDGVPPPLMSQNNEGVPPPLMSQNNAEVPPPLMSQNNDGVPPPLMSQNNEGVPPPLMSQNTEKSPPVIQDNGSNPRFGPMRRMVDENSNSGKVNAQNTLAPPTPDFRQPQLMSENKTRK